MTMTEKEQLFELLSLTKALTPEIEQKIITVYGKRGIRAIDAIKHNCVIKRGRRWFVKGKTDEYEVYNGSCTCKDHVMNIITGKAKVDMCYHVLAKRIFEITH